MNELSRCFMWWTVLTAAGASAVAPATGADKPPAAPRAGAIAPFVEEQTVGVAHADLSECDAAPLFERLAALLPELSDLPKARNAVSGWIRGFRRAGGKEIFAVATLTGEIRVPRVWLLVPLGPNADEKALRALFPGLEQAAARRGDFLVLPLSADPGRPVGPGPSASAETAELLKRLRPAQRPEVAAAFEAAGATAVQLLVLPPRHTAQAIEQTMPELPEEAGGGSSRVLTDGLLWGAVGITPPPGIELRVVIQSKDARAAEALRAKLAEWVQLLARQKPVLQELPQFAQLATLLIPKTEGDRLVLTLREQDPQFQKILAVLQASAAPWTEAVGREKSANNLKHLGLAMHNFHDSFRRFPAPANYDKDGKPLLSWRVHVLPYVEQSSLYQQFRLNEPWDSPHNRALIEKMPRIYRSPKSKLGGQGRSNYVVPVGPATMFPGKEGISLAEVKDGTSNTLMVLEVGDQQAPIWTRPDDWPFDPKDPAKGLGGLYAGGFWATMADGSAHFLALPHDAARLAALLTRAGGEVIRW
jgi:hypothetical protein